MPRECDSYTDYIDRIETNLIRDLKKEYPEIEIIFYPKRENDPGMILELKVDYTPEEALKQIKNKNYKLRFQGKLAEKKMAVKKILGIGISYDRKTKKYSCQVEWL